MTWFSRTQLEGLKKDIYYPPFVAPAASEYSQDPKGNARATSEPRWLEPLTIQILLGDPNNNGGFDSGDPPNYVGHLVDPIRNYYIDANLATSDANGPSMECRIVTPLDGTNLLDGQFIMGVCVGKTFNATNPDDLGRPLYIPINNPQPGFLCLYDASLNDFLDPWPKNSISPVRALTGGVCCAEVDLGFQLAVCNKFGPVPDGNLIFVCLAGFCYYLVCTECG